MKKMVAGLAALLCAQAAAADVLIDNVNGYTLDQKGELLRFTGLVVGDDGRVEKLLDKKDKRPRTDFLTDGKGRTLIPGMIDGHGHVMGLGHLVLSLDLTGTKSLAEAQAKIAAYAAANPSPRWIVGHGWNQETWGLGRFPTAAELDVIVPGRPVWLRRIDGHAAWANSLAMKEAGITAETKSPADGRIEKTGKQPSGVFIDGAMLLVDKVVPPPLPRTNDNALLKAQDIMLSLGLTAVADMGTSKDDWLTFRRAADRGALDVRVLSYSAGVDPLLAVAGTGPTPWLYDSKLRMVGMKLLSDGALGSRGASLKRDYHDQPGQKGLSFLGDAELKNLMSRAAMDGFQVAVHAIGDAANAQLLSAIEELSETYKGDRRWRVEHAQIVDPADLTRFARHGIIASMQPVHETSDWQMAEARLGLDRLGGAYAWKSMIDNKVPLSFGSDFPVESPNPFAGLAAAVSREDPSGQPPGGWQPQEKISLLQAFDAFTRGAAYASFAEDRLGTLEKGRMADFVFIDRDLFADGVTAQQIRDTKVLETWVAGEKVWERK